MDSEQICLKWNNFPLNITKNIDDLWKDESLVDVSIFSQGQCLQAHKIILSASSPLFKNIFSVNPCQHPVIILQDVGFRELVSIMSFIYKGEVNIEQNDLPELLKAAKTLQIRGLSDSVTLGNEALRSDKSERPSKKRKIQNTIIDSNIAHQSDSNQTSFSNFNEESCSKMEPETEINQKDETDGSEFVQAHLEENIKDEIDDEEDMKMDNDTFNDSSQLYPSDSGGNHDPDYVNPWLLDPPFDNRLGHVPTKCGTNEKGRVLRKRCHQCAKMKKRKDSSYLCNMCPGSPGLCISCFVAYHK